jgi:hypothetical protein
MSPEELRKPNVSQTVPVRTIRTRRAPIKRASLYLCALALGAVLAACSEQQPAPLAPVTLAASSAPTDPGAPATLGWNEQALTLVAANSVGPVPAARIYAALSLTQYAALNEPRANSNPGDNPRITGPDDDGRGSSGSWERGAVAGASARVLGFFFPGAAASLAQRVSAETENNRQFARGLEAGTRLADVMIERVRNDHFTDPWTGTVPVGPGLWTNVGPPQAPMLGKMTPYFLTSGDQFRSPPPAFGSAAFLADLQEVRTISDNRPSNPDQLALARFWHYGAGTVTPHMCSRS